MTIVTNKSSDEPIVYCKGVEGHIELVVCRPHGGKVGVELTIQEALALLEFLQDAIDSFDEPKKGE